MIRRLVMFAVLVALAAVVAGVHFSAASFTTTSATQVRAATSPLAADTIRIYAGNTQTATAGAAIAVAPSVVVTDIGGNPVSGVTVVFAVASGGGSVTGATTTTSASGVAAADGWTLGTTVGANSLTATAQGLSAPTVTFTATGAVGPASKYVVTAGGYSPVVDTQVTISAQLADQHGNAVKTAGISVRWSETGADGSLSASRTNTNSNGIATVVLTTGTTAGVTYTVTATSSSPSTRTGTSPGITTIAGSAAEYLVTASTYSPTAGTQVTISAQLADEYDNPVTTAGVSVSWSKSGTGGSLSASKTTTDETGVATVVLTTSSVKGRTYKVTATSTNPSATGTSSSITTK